MKLKLPPNNQALFHAAGLLSTVASVSGVFGYLMVENNAVGKLLSIGGFMSVGGAVGLGLSIYFGWEVAFNHKGIAKRLAAGCIAASAATLSGYTIYQNTANPILEQAHTAQVQQANRTLQQQDAATAALKLQQADLRTQIEDLRQQNTADTASIKTLEEGGKKGAAWQVAELRKAMDGRTAEITKLSDRVENYTQRLTATPTPSAGTEGKSDQQTTTTDKPVLSWAMLARASMYEVLTALFLLFGSWYRGDRSVKENAQATELHVVTRTAQTALQDLQNMVVTCNGAIAHANETANRLFACANDGANKPFACANEPLNGEKKELTQESAIFLLKSQAVQRSNDGNITIEQIMLATGWGKPRAIKLLELAWGQGSLERKQAGRGWTYCYPSDQQTAQPFDLANVVQLTARNA